MILGLDISTQKIGVAVVKRNEELLLSDVIKFPKDCSLEQKASIFEAEIKTLFHTHNIDSVLIEEPFISFSGGGGSAQTTAILHTFSGMCRYIIFQSRSIQPEMVNVRQARSKLGIKIPKGSKGKQKKEPVIEFVINKYKNFHYEKTIHGNYKPGIDDKADAIIIALSGIIH